MTAGSRATTSSTRRSRPWSGSSSWWSLAPRWRSRSGSSSSRRRRSTVAAVAALYRWRGWQHPLFATTQEAQADRKRSEQTDKACSDLHAEKPLLGPVDVVELQEQRGLVHRHPHPRAEQQRQPGLEILVARHDRDRAAQERQRDARHEVVDVATAEPYVAERAQPTAVAQRERNPTRGQQADHKRCEQVEESVLLGRRGLVTGHRDRRRLDASLDRRLDNVVRLRRQRRRAATPDATELDHECADGRHRGSAANCRRAALLGGPALAPPQRQFSISSSSPTNPLRFAGTPITRVRAGTSRVTTAPVATNASSPTSTPGRMRAPPPTRQARRRIAPVSAAPFACRPIVLSL